MVHLLIGFQITALILGSILAYRFYNLYKNNKDKLDQYLFSLISLSLGILVVELVRIYIVTNLNHNFLHNLPVILITLFTFAFWIIIPYTYYLIYCKFANAPLNKNIIIIFFSVSLLFFLLVQYKILYFRFDYSIFHLCTFCGLTVYPVILITIELFFFIKKTRALKNIAPEHNYLLLLFSGYLLFLLSLLIRDIHDYGFVVLTLYLFAVTKYWHSRYFSIKAMSKTLNLPDTAHLSMAKDFNLTERESEILALLLNGKSNKEIENSLFISPNTTRNHIASIYKKACVNSRSQLLSIALKRQDFGKSSE